MLIDLWWKILDLLKQSNGIDSLKSLRLVNHEIKCLSESFISQNNNREDETNCIKLYQNSHQWYKNNYFLEDSSVFCVIGATLKQKSSNSCEFLIGCFINLSFNKPSKVEVIYSVDEWMTENKIQADVKSFDKVSSSLMPFIVKIGDL